LKFPLLADPTLKIAGKYGVWRQKTNGGRDFVGLVRGTFLIDPSGRLAHVWDNVRVKGHAEKVLTALRAEVEVS
jgi:peroxiredoxin Q/BCP